MSNPSPTPVKDQQDQNTGSSTLKIVGYVSLGIVGLIGIIYIIFAGRNLGLKHYKAHLKREYDVLYGRGGKPGIMDIKYPRFVAPSPTRP